MNFGEEVVSFGEADLNFGEADLNFGETDVKFGEVDVEVGEVDVSFGVLGENSSNNNGTAFNKNINNQVFCKVFNINVGIFDKLLLL